jgi:hypothetical protein
MSYTMCIYYNDGSEKDINIAAEGDFSTYWLKPAQELSLQIIPYVVNAVRIVTQEGAKKFLDDLKTVHEYHVRRNLGQYEMEKSRILATIKIFEEAISNWESIKYIGFF